MVVVVLVVVVMVVVVMVMAMVMVMMVMVDVVVMMVVNVSAVAAGTRGPDNCSHGDRQRALSHREWCRRRRRGQSPHDDGEESSRTDEERTNAKQQRATNIERTGLQIERNAIERRRCKKTTHQRTILNYGYVSKMKSKSGKDDERKQPAVPITEAAVTLDAL